MRFAASPDEVDDLIVSVLRNVATVDHHHLIALVQLRITSNKIIFKNYSQCHFLSYSKYSYLKQNITFKNLSTSSLL